MKTFLQFITESTATQQAARLGLQSDGHGGWTDRTTGCLLYTSPSPRDATLSRMPSSA